MINDDLDITGDETDYGSIPSETDRDDSEHETDGEDGFNNTIVESNKTNSDPTQGTTHQVPKQDPKHVPKTNLHPKETLLKQAGKEKTRKVLCKYKQPEKEKARALSSKVAKRVHEFLI